MAIQTMTPTEFADAIRGAIADSSKMHGSQGQAEANAHSDMDEIMCRVLEELGYGEGVKIFRAAERWYE